MIKAQSTKLEKAFNDFGISLKSVKENTVDITVIYNGKESAFLNEPLIKGYFQLLFDVKKPSIIELAKCDYSDDLEERIVYPKLEGNTCTRYFRAAFIGIEEKKASAKCPVKKIESFEDEADDIPVIKPRLKKIANKEVNKPAELDIESVTSAILSSPEFAATIAAAVKAALKK
jgi:5'-3' exonuclease